LDFAVGPIDVRSGDGLAGVEEVVDAPQRIGDVEVAASVPPFAEDLAVENVVAAGHSAGAVFVEQIVTIPDERNGVGRAAMMRASAQAVRSVGAGRVAYPAAAIGRCVAGRGWDAGIRPKRRSGSARGRNGPVERV